MSIGISVGVGIGGGAAPMATPAAGYLDIGGGLDANAVFTQRAPQSDAEAFPWWDQKLYGQDVFIGSHELDPTVYEPISRRTAHLLEMHCGANVDYDVTSASASNYHTPHPNHEAAFAGHQPPYDTAWSFP